MSKTDTHIQHQEISQSSRTLDEKSLTESEMRYLHLFDSIFDGLAICEFLCDVNGQPTDYRIREVNPSFAAIIGAQREQLIGSDNSAFVPFFNNLGLDRLISVGLTRETFHFEEFSPILKHYYEGFAYSLPKNYFAISLSDVTERKCEEENSLWLSSFPEQNPMPVLEVDYEGRITYQNPASQKLFMAEGGNGNLQNFLAVIRSVIDKFMEGDERNLPKDVQFGNTWLLLNFYHMPQLKRIRTYSVDISDLVKAQSALIEMNKNLEQTVTLRTQELNRLNIELTQDIFRREQSEKNLEREHKRFNDVLEFLPAYVILLSPDGRISFANKFFKDSFLWLREVQFDAISNFRNKPKEVENTFKPLISGRSNVWEWTGPQHRIYTVYDFPFKDVDGSPLILEIGLDITEIRLTQEKLLETSNYNRSLIDANLDFLATITQDGIIDDVNTAAQLATGLSREELIGSRFDSYFENAAAANRGIQLVLETGSVRNYELSLKHKDGHTTPVAYNASFYTDLEGKVGGIFAGARDLTELRRNEKQLLELNHALEEAIAHEVAIRDQLVQTEKFSAMGRMLASVTHEINNPLQTITNCQYLIASEVQTGSQAHQFLEMAMTETGRISKLVGELKDFYRPRQEYNFAPVYLPALLDNIHNLLKLQLSEMHVDWNLVWDEDLAADMWVEAIEDQLKQVVINLSMNACDAMQPNGGLFQVTLVNGKNNEIGVLFSDTGPGIDPSDLRNIFEPFFSTKKQGLGLGLSICYDILQRHHGRIEVSSILGKGTTFEVWLPACETKKNPGR
jgi:PAS domain S-box-containing protein